MKEDIAKLRARLAEADKGWKLDADLLGETAYKLAALEKRHADLKAAARRLFDNVGDGDNGPLPSFLDDWIILGEELNDDAAENTDKKGMKDDN